MTVVVAGHVCVDLTPQLIGTNPGLTPGTLYTVGPLGQRTGGSVANTGGTLAALGVPVRAFATVGSDELAAVCRAQLIERIGSDVCLTISPLGTSYSIVIEHPSHDRTFWQHEGACADFDPTSVGLADDVEALHIGYPSLLPSLCHDPDPLQALLAKARSCGVTTSLDLAHVAEGSLASQVDWADWFARIIPQIDVWSPSWDDVTSALGIHEAPTPAALDRMAEQMLGMGAAVVSLSAGNLGFILKAASAERLRRGGRMLLPLAEKWAGQSAWHAAEQIVRPHTTVGAGDALTGGLLDALRKGLSLDAAGVHARDTVGRHLRGEPFA